MHISFYCDLSHKIVQFFIRLTQWGRVTHICISKIASIGSDNGLSPGWHQAIIWTWDVNLVSILKKIACYTGTKLCQWVSSKETWCLRWGYHQIQLALFWYIFLMPHIHWIAPWASCPNMDFMGRGNYFGWNFMKQFKTPLLYFVTLKYDHK